MKLKIQQINFWLGEHVPFAHSHHRGPTLRGERQDLLTKLYRGESTVPWCPVKEKTMEAVTRDDVDWPESVCFAELRYSLRAALTQ